MTVKPVDHGRILLADDEEAFQRLGSAFLESHGYQVRVASSSDEATEQFDRNWAEVVILDLAMPPSMDPEIGLQLIPYFAPAPVIVLTGHGEHALALRAAELGAWDFLTKPLEPDLLALVCSRALRKSRLERELADVHARDSEDDLGLIGESVVMRDLRSMVRRVAQTNIPVLVLGPTGSGKELVARGIHHLSARSRGPFVAINCGALSAELLESELFGHLRGSFTGAHRDQAGLVETAHGGTLFLDEVGEMPLAMQVKLLRFLQEGSFVPVGGRSTKRSDVRVLAATHRDLSQMVSEGSLREDLYYRLKGIVIRTPALAERSADIPALATRFLRRALPAARLSQDALAWLIAHDWPGNVRQLKSMMESAGALLLPGTTSVDAALLRLADGDPDSAATRLPRIDSHEGGLLEIAVRELETRLIRDTMESSGGNQSEAARRLGISRVGLIKKMARLNLRAPRNPDEGA